MQFDARYQIEQAALSTKDGSRPILQHVNVRRLGDLDNPRAGVLEAADGFILARVPCELEEWDTEGIVSVAVLAAARKARRRAEPHVTMTLNEHEVFINGSTRLPRTDGLQAADAHKTYPDLDRIISKLDRSEDATRVAVWAVDPLLLVRLQKALGDSGVWVFPGATALSPVLVIPTNPRDKALGVLMPFHAVR